MSIDELLEILDEHKRRIKHLERLLESMETNSHRNAYIPRFDDEPDLDLDEESDWETDFDDFEDDNFDEEDDDCDIDFDDFEDTFEEDEMPPFCEVGLIGIIRWFRDWRRKMKLREGVYEL